MKRNAEAGRFNALAPCMILLFLFLSTPCRAGMKQLTDNQLSAIYTTGFSSFTITSEADGTDDRRRYSIFTLLHLLPSIH